MEYFYKIPTSLPMPIIKSAFSRYQVIDRCLNNKQRKYPTLEKLAEACWDKLNIEVSVSTIEKDIAAMKRPAPIGFSAPIVYNKREKGYAYAEQGFSILGLSLEPEEWEGLQYAAKLLNQYKDVPVFKNFKSAIEKIDTGFNLGIDLNDEAITKYVQFETAVATSGYEWIAIIYQAITNRFLLTITYDNIYKKETKQYELVPYLLKEHRNRWYLIAWVEERKDYLTFALDRIQELSSGEERQKIRSDFNADLFLQYATGIMEGNGKPYKVVLTIDKPFNKLVKLEPLHASQKIIKDVKDTLKIELTVNINPEFCMRLLSMGPYCKIIQPASLKLQIKELLKQTLKQYK